MPISAALKMALADDGFRQAAWVTGPLGVALLVVGVWLGLAAHAAFWVLALGGALLLGVGIGIGVIAAAKLKPDR